MLAVMTYSWLETKEWRYPGMAGNHNRDGYEAHRAVSLGLPQALSPAVVQWSLKMLTTIYSWGTDRSSFTLTPLYIVIWGYLAQIYL